jgi:hypothetical protein
MPEVPPSTPTGLVNRKPAENRKKSWFDNIFEDKKKKKAEEALRNAQSPMALADEKHNAKITSLLELATNNSPPALARLLLQFAPVIRILMAILSVVAPIYLKAFQLLHAIIKVMPWDLVQALVGLGLCFFGGKYCASIAAAEAFYLTGWARTRGALGQIYTEVVLVVDANEKDDKKDDDGDGVADVKQLGAQALVLRKCKMAASAVKDPERLSEAIAGIYTGWIAVQGTLRIEFAKTITLGVSMAQCVEYPVLKYVLPIVTPLAPKEVQHWGPTAVSAATKAAAVWFAWTLQVYVSAVQSAMRGGLLFSRGLMAYANKTGRLQLRADDSLVDEFVGYFIAALGFYVQWNLGFDLPFPFNLIMFPFTMIEWYIRWSITSLP